MKRPPIHVKSRSLPSLRANRRRVPLLVDVSRSGREYPKEYRSPLPFTTVHDNVSMYVEDLWAGTPGVGGTLLYCSFPNTWIDVNRNELDMDPALVDGTWPVKLEPTARTLEGLGLIKTKARYGEPFQERKLTVAEIEERLTRYYRPYHAELKRIADDLHRRFGVLRQISCHCMSAVGAPTHPDAGKARAGFLRERSQRQDGVEGGRGGDRRDAEELRLHRLRERSLRRQRADQAHRRSRARIDSIQVEINKKLFMDTKTFRATENLPKVRTDLDRLLRVVAKEMVRLARRA